MRGFLPQANCACKLEHPGSAELARNRDVFIFRAALPENGEEAAKRARGHLLRISRASRKTAGKGTTEAGAWDGGLSLVYVIWDGKVKTRIRDGWMLFVCLCSDICRSAKDRGACGVKWDWLQLRRGNKSLHRHKHQRSIKDCGGKKNRIEQNIHVNNDLLLPSTACQEISLAQKHCDFKINICTFTELRVGRWGWTDTLGFNRLVVVGQRGWMVWLWCGWMDWLYWEFYYALLTETTGFFKQNFYSLKRYLFLFVENLYLPWENELTLEKQKEEPEI